MKILGCIFFSILFLFIAVADAKVILEAGKRVIILGIDGFSTDGIQIASAPNINKLIHSGAISLKARAVMPTVSAPNWTSMLTGAGPEQHGITKNGWTQENATIKPTVKDSDGLFPSIFTVLREQKPDAIIGAFYDWDELANFYNWKSADTVVYIKAETLDDYIAGDKEAYRRAISYIIEKKPDLTFIYAGSVDETGHELGHGTEAYYKSISTVDSLVGDLMTVLKNNGMYESTYFIIITDHGGVGFGHGGESMDEIQVPWIISGPGIINDRMIDQPMNSIDTAPTVAHIFGIQQPDAWTGRPVLGAFISDVSSNSNRHKYLPKPAISMKSGFYPEPQTISMSVNTESADIRYTTDGSEPTMSSLLYKHPVQLSHSTVVRSIAVRRETKSQEAVLNFIKNHEVKNISLTNPASEKYKGGGARSLIDGKRALLDYKDPAWLGFEGDNLETILDFGKPTEISKITIGYLSNISSWIFPPKGVVFQISDNGKNFRDVDSNTGPGDQNNSRGVRQITSKIFSNLNARYVSVKIINQGICPDDHPGAGEKAWLFVDEIYIE